MNSKETLAQEKLKNFFKTNISVQIFNIALAYLCFFLLKNDENFTAITTWICAFTLISIGRVLLFFRQKKFLNSYNGKGAIKELFYFRCSLFLAGLMWAIASILLYPNDAQYIYYLTYIIAGVITGALIAYSIDPISTLIYPLLVSIPLAYSFVFDSKKEAVPLIFYILILLLFVMINSRRTSKNMENLIISKNKLQSKEQQTALIKTQYHLLLKQSPVGIVYYDLNMNINYFNKQFAKIMRLEKFDEKSYKIFENQSSIEFAKDALKGKITKYSGPHQLGINKRIIWINSISSPIKDEKENIIGGISIIQDITKYKSVEKEIKQFELYDPLTTLPNKQMLMNKLNKSIKNNQSKSCDCTLMLLDIDYFKLLNETLGHNLGDVFLKEAAFRIRRCVKENDFVARIGGDEFVILLHCDTNSHKNIKQTAQNIAQRILENISKPYNLMGHKYNTSASVGIVTTCKDKSSEDVLKQADIAMYQAKRAGRNSIKFFDQTMQYEVTKRVKIEYELNNAIKNREFILHFQPQVHNDGTIYGVEALIRWNHPQRGIIYPKDFISIAEEKDLINDIGQQVIQMAFEQMSKWKSSPTLSKISMSININSAQFERDDFVQNIFDLIDKYQIDPNLIKFEFTEGTLLTCSEEIIEKMKLVRKKGIKFSLDDFGIGYSSLFYLKKLPVDELKIDRSFVQDINYDTNEFNIVKTIAAIAKSLKYNLIAEGIENKTQQNVLLDVKCNKFQGFLYSRPILANTLEKIVQKNGKLQMKKNKP